MPSDRVVVVVDPVLRLRGQVFDAGPWPGVDQLLLVGREERFGDGIVVTDAGPSQGTANAVASAVRVEFPGGVLGAMPLS
jgi:hypothetical protein